MTTETTGESRQQDNAQLPLHGVKVLDLSRALSGPFCATILGDLGADVVKVEPLPDGDMVRSWGPFDRDVSAYFLSANRNKRGVAIDFRSDAGRAILLEMARKSDVIVENFMPGTLAKMELDPEQLMAENPRLIIASISGFGQSGPLASRPGFDQIAQGYSGLMSVTGTSESGPTRVGVAIGDMTSGMWLAIGVLAAYMDVVRTGRGQKVDTSLFAGLISLLSVQGQRYLSLDEIAPLAGNVHPVIAPYGVFRAGDGEINIGAATQNMWLGLCDVVGRPEWKNDPRFVANAQRMANRDELKRLIEDELAKTTRDVWTARLVAAGIPAGPINTIEDAIESEQVKHLGLIESISLGLRGNFRQITNPIRLSNKKADGWMRSGPAMLGQHTREVLAELGFTSSQIADWETGSVVYQTTDA
ncbi:crotonobetainyl-CoA:carnitine CoA-transferase CaiB-like acyl-CoA transferase [Nitrobacteraceae bacterium AZCC 2161]